MSWWDVDAENVTGDGPADVIRSALYEIAEACDRQGRPRPTLAEALGGFARALKAYEGDPGGGDFQRLEARLRSSPEPVRGAEGAAAGRAAEAFGRAFTQIEEQYAERWERKPRRPELIAALDFILGYSPERFLSSAEGVSVLEIVAL